MLFAGYMEFKVNPLTLYDQFKIISLHISKHYNVMFCNVYFYFILKVLSKCLQILLHFIQNFEVVRK